MKYTWGVCGIALQDMVFVLNQWLMYDAMSPKVGICMSWKHGMEGLDLLIIVSMENVCFLFPQL